MSLFMSAASTWASLELLELELLELLELELLELEELELEELLELELLEESLLVSMSASASTWANSTISLFMSTASTSALLLLELDELLEEELELLELELDELELELLDEELLDESLLVSTSASASTWARVSTSLFKSTTSTSALELLLLDELELLDEEELELLLLEELELLDEEELELLSDLASMSALV